MIIVAGVVSACFIIIAIYYAIVHLKNRKLNEFEAA